MPSLDALRKQHPRFVYRGYDIAEQDGDLRLTFDFLIEPDIEFAPTLTLHNAAKPASALPPGVQENLTFHLGLAEIPSYWKAAASPEIVVAAGPLDGAQITWWHKLLLEGMGEYFYVNQIDFTQPGFVRILAENEEEPFARDERIFDERRFLIPIGGGKDSAVTLQLLRDLPHACFGLNPIAAASLMMEGCTEQIRVTRRIDRRLLDLNAAGYLNGHTPFSSVVAFVSTACAQIFGYSHIVLSNERSSNEGNVFWLGREINHQYSKTFEFEQAFRQYVDRYIGPVVYFSFLRPLYEVQIARLFARMPDYHQVFLSCNRGQKTNTWCHECSKCLFVFTALYPFIGWEGLSTIFDHDLFHDTDLLPIAHELIGTADQKPFECVGTHAETALAFSMSLQQAGNPTPPLLAALAPELPPVDKTLLDAWNPEHALPADLVALLKDALHA
ncbi:MAG: hypothetical protein ACFB51_14010 [Anaerolineae bacterium]